MGSCVSALSRLSFIVTLALAGAAWGQANVNESLETSYIYVDGTKGSDSNNGSQSSPYATIGKAASTALTNNYNGIGTRVTINPGTYRESVTLNYDTRDTSLPITFEAAKKGTVIMSGATVYSGWTTYKTNPKIYTTTWTNTWGICSQITICPYQQDIMMRQEMVAVNGTVMTQVLSEVQMQPGTFYVDSTDALLYVWPPSGTNMNTATVEAASESAIFQIWGMSNIVVRGMVFQYANSCRDYAAVNVVGNASNILFDSDTFQWNNSIGITIMYPVTYFTVQNSVASHNGQTGFQDSQTKYGYWANNTANYNNWRGAQAGYYGCNTAGYHASLTHYDTINSLTAAFNETFGAHWDTDNANITASNINANGNFVSGVFLEKDEGPIAISNSYMCNQSAGPSGAGLMLRNSENVSLTGSVVLNNSLSQILVIGQAGGIEVTNWETGVTTNLVTQNFSNTSNAIQGNASTQALVSDSYLDDADWTSFQTTLVSSSNTWWNALNSTSEFVVPSPRINSKDSLSGWQSLTLADNTSVFKALNLKQLNSCIKTPMGTDYWFTVNTNLLTVSPGKSVSYTLTQTPFNFLGTTNLTLDGISEVPGLSATLSQSSIPISGTSTLTVTVASNTAPGTYSITVIANSGNLTHTVTVQLTVN